VGVAPPDPVDALGCTGGVLFACRSIGLRDAIVDSITRWIRYIKHRNQLQRLEAELASKEQLADGLHFIDFEQLKLTNQAHNEKIEERNVELARLKSKIMSTVQVILVPAISIHPTKPVILTQSLVGDECHHTMPHLSTL
jgi:hypothetical protein